MDKTEKRGAVGPNRALAWKSWILNLHNDFGYTPAQIHKMLLEQFPEAREKNILKGSVANLIKKNKKKKVTPALKTDKRFDERGNKSAIIRNAVYEMILNSSQININQLVVDAGCRENQIMQVIGQDVLNGKLKISNSDGVVQFFKKPLNVPEKVVDPSQDLLKQLGDFVSSVGGMDNILNILSAYDRMEKK